MSLWAILLAGLAVSMLVEGLLFLAAPGAARSMLKTLSDLPERELALAGAVSAGIGTAFLAFVVYMA
jgi:uncharacterized protein YjeT (DUF2065 family)